MSGRFGWCLDGHHQGVPDMAGQGAGCPGTLGSTRCSCRCHGESHETRAESTATCSSSPIPHQSNGRRFNAHESEPGHWVVVGPEGDLAKVSGASSWPSEEMAEAVAQTANRRKVRAWG